VLGSIETQTDGDVPSDSLQPDLQVLVELAGVAKKVCVRNGFECGELALKSRELVLDLNSALKASISR